MLKCHRRWNSFCAVNSLGTIHWISNAATTARMAFRWLIPIRTSMRTHSSRAPVRRPQQRLQPSQQRIGHTTDTRIRSLLSTASRLAVELSRQLCKNVRQTAEPLQPYMGRNCIKIIARVIQWIYQYSSLPTDTLFTKHTKQKHDIQHLQINTQIYLFLLNEWNPQPRSNYIKNNTQTIINNYNSFRFHLCILYIQSKQKLQITTLTLKVNKEANTS